jgi:hypothetical protein
MTARTQLVHAARRPEILSGRDVPDDADVIIWNAPRPLAGTHTWQGPFVCGVFYAAGPRDQYAQGNEALDAAEIRFVTNADVRALLVAQLAANGYTLDDYAEAGVSLAEAACLHHLPWDDHEEEG